MAPVDDALPWLVLERPFFPSKYFPPILRCSFDRLPASSIHGALDDGGSFCNISLLESFITFTFDKHRMVSVNLTRHILRRSTWDYWGGGGYGFTQVWKPKVCIIV